MYINADKVILLHVEPTTKCNASCPGCPRNRYGFGVSENLVLQDLDPDVIIGRARELPNLKTIHLCGNLGDPIAYKHLNELIDKAVAQTRFFHQYLKVDKCWDVNIATNGSLRSVKWWQELGKKCSIDLTNSHSVVFGIDGLADTSPIYRQGTNFNKVIDNAKAFIDEGGVAEWQYLKFKHNQHQVEEARKLAEDIGFNKFYASQPYFSPAYHWKTGKRYYLEPADDGEFDRPRNFDDHSKRWEKHFTASDQRMSSLTPAQEVAQFSTDNTYVEKNKCMHIDVDGSGNGNYSLFLTVGGKIIPCCYFDLRGTLRESFDMKTIDIENEFNTENYRFTCRRLCGSIK